LGYTLVFADGSMNAFGDAVPPAATSMPKNGTFVAATPSALGGAWLTTGEGKVVAAGGAPSLPDLSRRTPATPVIDIASSATGNGYFLLMANGTVKAFGDAR
jgi:hypothetical protein